MSADGKHEFPHWEDLYQEREIESMPWFHPELDDDLKKALDELGLRGGSALDLGSGPGTQAMQLVRRGFGVTATDLSEAAIRRARSKAEEQGLAITWEQDDILDARFDGPFDLIFDRGCFHVLAPERRPDYVKIVPSMKINVILILPIFSSSFLSLGGRAMALIMSQNAETQKSFRFPAHGCPCCSSIKVNSRR